LRHSMEKDHSLAKLVRRLENRLSTMKI